MYRTGCVLLFTILMGVNSEFLLKQCSSKEVTLTAIADCVVRKTLPDTAFPTEQNLTAFKTDAENQTFFLWQFQLPADCVASAIDGSTFRFRNVLVKKQQTVNRGAYIYIIKDAAEIAAGDVNAYTFNTAPGVLKNLTEIIGTAQTDANTSVYSGYGTPTATEGAEWVYTPTGAYLTSLTSQLAADTNGRLTFLFHPRYGDTIGDLWASIENTQYHGPQIVISYTSNGNGIGITVAQSDGETTVYEGANSDSYTIVLNEVPEDDVQVAINTNGSTSVEPSVITFTQSNWNVPQQIVVAAEDDLTDLSPNLNYSIISHVVTSSDIYYNAVLIPDINVRVYDDEGVCDGVEFLTEDITSDCSIDMPDLMSLLSEWMECNDPARPDICE